MPRYGRQLWYRDWHFRERRERPMASTDLAIPKLNARGLELVREQLAPEASPEELEWFAAVANHLKLDPFRQHIVLIGRYDKRARRKIHRPQITVDGRLALAERTGELAGIDGPVWCGPREQWGGELVWHEVWLDDAQPPYCARVLVHRKGRDNPTANGTAKWSEFHQTDSEGGVAPLWRRMPSHMLGKVALNMALRRAFSEVIDIPVEAEFDGIDAAVDVASVPSTSAGSSEDGPRGTSPSAQPTPSQTPMEFVLPTPDQVARVKELRASVGLAEPELRASWLAYVGGIVGRDVNDTRELSRDEVGALIAGIETELDGRG